MYVITQLILLVIKKVNNNYRLFLLYLKKTLNILLRNLSLAISIDAVVSPPNVHDVWPLPCVSRFFLDSIPGSENVLIIQ